MANKDNQSQRFIYIRSLKEKVPCTEQQFQEFYREATRIRKKEQYYHRCKCPKQFIWACDGDCENCEHHLGYGQAESLFCRKNKNVPNNVFPLMWWKQYADHTHRNTLFVRLQEGY